MEKGKIGKKIAKVIMMSVIILLAISVMVVGGSTGLSKIIQMQLNAEVESQINAKMEEQEQLREQAKVAQEEQEIDAGLQEVAANENQTNEVQAINSSARLALGKEIAKITHGDNYYFALKSDGTLWAWGVNSNGRLGTGNKERVYIPVPVIDTDGVTPLRNVVDVGSYGNLIGNSTGVNAYGGVALKADGTVVSWGTNVYGELGAGDEVSATDHAVQVVKQDGTPLTNVTKIATGGGHTIAATSEGEVYAWGYNGYGAIAKPGTYKYARLVEELPKLNNIKQLAAGVSTCAVLLEDGTMWTWGYMGWGIFENTMNGSNCSYTPFKSTQTDIKKVILGTENIVLLKEDGTVYTRGGARYNQLGNGATQNSAEYNKILTDVKDIGCSGQSFFALKNNEELYAWGANTYNQLGIEGEAVRPTIVPDLTGKVYKLPDTAGRDNSCIVDKNGNLLLSGKGSGLLFGYNDNGTLKSTNQTFKKFTYSIEARMKFTDELNILNVGETKNISGNIVYAEGFNYNLFTNATFGVVQYESLDENVATVSQSGKVTAVGIGRTKIKATMDDIEIFTTIEVPNPNDKVKIVNGVNFVAGLKIDGTVVAWGKNTYGNLGNGTTIDSEKPIQVLDTDGTTLTEIKDIAAMGMISSGWNYATGSTEAMAVLREDGTVWTVGSNKSGQLGNGINDDSSVLVQVIKQDDTPLTDIVKIYSGTGAFYALTIKGEVYAWGLNNYSQLGDGKTENSNKAKKIENLTGVIDLTTGYCSAIALKTDGTAYAWGLGTYGCLGTGVNANAKVPTKVKTENIKQIVAGVYTVYVLKDDGTVWGAGNGAYYIGSGTNSGSVLNFEQIKGINGEGYLENITQLGENYGIFAIDKEGEVYAWGYNYGGNLGVDIEKRQYPQPVYAIKNMPLKGKIEKLQDSANAQTTFLLAKNGDIWGAGSGVLFNKVYDEYNGELNPYFVPVHQLGIKFSQIAYNINLGSSTTLKLEEKEGVNLYNLQADTKNVTYKSSDETIATIDNTGRITGKKNGQVTITAINANGMEAECRVTVSNSKSRAKVSSQYGVSIALKSDGSVWSWGFNTNGALGNGTNIDSVDPVKVLDIDGKTPLTNVIDVSAQGKYNGVRAAEGGVALKNDGTVVTWGGGSYGQLGNGADKDSNHAVQVIKEDGTPLDNIRKIAASNAHVAAISNDGKLYTWGYNSNGQLGDATKTNSNVAKEITNIKNVIDVGTGYEATVCTTAEGKVYGAGYNGNSCELGTEAIKNGFRKINIDNVKKVLVNEQSMMILKNDKTLWALGTGGNGQQGDGETTHNAVPTQVKSPDGAGFLENVKDVGASWYGYFALTEDDKLYAWGNNEQGQLGLGDTTNRKLPTEVKDKDGNNLGSKVALLQQTPGNKAVILVMKDGSLYGAGAVSNRLFGVQSGANKTIFEQIFEQCLAFENNRPYIKMGTTEQLKLKIGEGFNLYGNELSLDGMTYVSSNEKVAKVDENTGTVTGISRGTATIIATNENGDQARCIVSIISNKPEAITLPQVEVTSNGGTIVLKEDGTVWSVGNNQYGVLGSGNTTARYDIQQVKISETTYLENVVKISSPSPNTVIAVTKDGEAYSWGHGTQGTLGLGDDKKVHTYYATKMPNIEGIVDVTTSGQLSTKLLTNKGEVYTVGYISVNQNGDGTTVSGIPHKIENIKNVVDISAGYTHCIALRGDGTAWTWGSNAAGELGNNKTANSLYPVQVQTEDGYLKNLVSVEAVDYVSTAIDENGNGYAWGSNNNGQLGYEDKQTNRKTAQKVYEVKEDGIKVLKFGGATGSLAYLLDNGKIYSSGKNNVGQLSQGDTTNLSSFTVAKTEDGKEFENGLFISNTCNNTIGGVLAVIQNNGSVWMAGHNGTGGLMTGDTKQRNYLTRVGTPTFAAKQYKIVLKPNETHKLEASDFCYEDVFNVFNDIEREIGTITYKSLNTDIAVVDADSGLVLGIKDGTTRIEVTNTVNNDKAYVLVKVVTGEIEPMVVGGYQHSLAIKSNGTLWGWGSNKYGQLGKDYDLVEKQPVAIKGPNGEPFKDVKMLAAGYYHSVVVTTNGDVYTWGHNAYGQLGDGTKANSDIPKKVELPEKITKVSTYQYRTVALGESGKVYVWGQKFSETPEQLDISMKVIDISGDYILREDKKVYLITNLKKQISGMNNIVSIDSGYMNHLLAMSVDGKVYSCKNNQYGQSGQGNTLQVLNPTLVKSPDGVGVLENIVEIHVALNGSIAKDIDGNAYLWGYNGFGQIGNNSTANATLPYMIENVDNVELVARSFGYHNILADADGYVYTVGAGGSGQKGDGTKAHTKQFARIGKTVVEPNKSTVKMEVGQVEEVLAKVKETFNLKRDEIETRLRYRIVDTDIARVDGIKVTALKVGRTFLIIEAEGLEASTTVQIEVVPDGATSIPQVEAGNNFTVALKADGTLWSWGTNKLGQLGTGDLEGRNEPFEIKGIDGTIKEISVNRNHTLVLSENGEVYAFGQNTYGEIGNGTKTNTKKPEKVMVKNGDEIEPLKDIIKVKAGKYESFAIDKNFDLWAWGWQYTTYAQKVAKLEGTDVIDVTEDYIIKNDGKLYKLKDLTEIETVDRVKHLSEGFDHTVMLTEDNKAYSIGKNVYGQLGNGNNESSLIEPVGVRQPDSENLIADIEEIKAGEYYTIAKTKDGKVYVWGNNANNRLGQTDDIKSSNLPIEYTGVSNVMLVSAGYHHTEIADNEGFVWNFGQGNLGQLGNRDNQNSVTPVMVGIYQLTGKLGNIKMAVGEQREVGAGVDYFNILKNGGEEVEYKSFDETIATVSVDGIITGIKQGRTTIEVRQKGKDNVILIQVEVVKEGQVAIPAVETKGSHAIILKADGSVYSFGQNTYGQLGDNTVELKDGTVRVEFNKSTKITKIDAGLEHNIALDLNGVVWTWGRNNYGQLGTGGANSKIPVKVELPEKIVKIAAGNYTSYAIGESGKAYAWGYNQNGELGIGSYRNVSTPTEIVNIASITDISGGTNHAILVDQKGEVYTTGSNVYGQLGMEKQKINQFTKVEGLYNIIEVEAGDNHNIVKTVNGEIYTWGSNIYGQLGLNDRLRRTEPVKVEGKTNILDMSGGKQNSILLNNDGQVYTVGANSYGQIGDITTITRQEYVEVTRIPDAIDVTIGDTFALAIREDGTVWAWGDYNHGAAGVTSKTKSIIPVMVGKDTSAVDGTEMVLQISEMKNVAIGTKENFNVYYNDVKYASDYTYESINPEIAKINEVGTVIGVRIGTTWVRAIDKKTGEVLTTIVRVIDNNRVAAPQIEGGNGFTVALKGNGTIWTWGYNPEGALGDGTYETALVPRQVNVLQTYRSISAGENHAIALRSNGTVWSWGSNSNGQLGIESYKNSPKLVQVHNLENVKMISSGAKHSVALNKNNVIYGWGSNAEGQLGLNNRNDVLNPTIIAVPELQVISLAAGKSQTVYATIDGSVYGMGPFLNGKLEGATNVIKVETNGSHIILLKDDATIWEYKNGVLSQISGINNAVDISAQRYTMSYQDRDEKTYCWGSNTDGKLGTNDLEDREVPTHVAEYGTSTFRVGAGFDNTYIIRNDGFVYAAGKNNFGQLGNSTQTSSLVHTLVGDRRFNLTPDNKIMTVNDVEELTIECKTFNMFNDDKKDKTEYEWTTSDENIVSVDVGTITAKAVGTATITATDRVTGETREAIRVVMPVDEQRIQALTVDGEPAKVVGDKAYSVTINTDKDLATLKVVTNDGTDKISIDGGNTYSSAGAIVKEIEVPEKVNNFTIRVQTQNGTEIDYTLEVIKKSKNMNLALLTVNDKEAIGKDSNTYEMVIDEDVDRLVIEAQAEHPDASVSINGEAFEVSVSTYEGEMEGLVKTVPITVKAECGTNTTYILTIYKKSALVELNEVKVNGKEATRISENEYNIVIERTANLSSVVVTASHELAKVAIGTDEAKVHTATSIISTNEEVTEVEIHVIAEIQTDAGTEQLTRTYRLTIYKARMNAKIDLLAVNGTTIIPTGNSYVAYLPNNIKEAEVRVVTALETDKVKIADQEEGTHDVTVKVSTEQLKNVYTVRVIDGETQAIQNYTLTIIKPSADTSIKEITAVAGDYETVAKVNAENDTVYELKVPDNFEEMSLKVVANSTVSKVTINGEEAQTAQSERSVNISGENVEIPVTIEAEDGTTQEYIVKVGKISTDNTLETVTVNGKQATKSATNENVYEFNLEEALTEVEVVATATHDLAKLYIKNGEYKPKTDTKTIIIDSKDVEVPILVKSENGDLAQYILKINGLPDNVNASFTVDNEEGEFVPGRNKYRFKINTNKTSHTFKGITEDPKAKIQIEGQDEKIGTATLALTNADVGREFEVTITSQNGLVTEKAIIEILAKSSDTEITYVRVDGKIVEPEDNGNYKVNVRHDVTESQVEVKLNDTYAKVDIAGIIEELLQATGYVPITGVTTNVPIKVTAEDGTTKTVTLTITRLDGEVGLRTLTVDGVVLTPDENGDYYYKMERKDTAKVVATAQNAKSAVSINSNDETASTQTLDVETLEEITNVSVLITAEDGTQQNYKLVIQKISDDALLKQIYALGIEPQFIKVTGEDSFEIKVPAITENLHLGAITNNEFASVKLKEEADDLYELHEMQRQIEITERETQVQITVKAENGITKDYTVTIIQLSDNVNIGQILVNGEEATKSDKEAATYEYHLTEPLTEATVKAIVQDANTKVAIGDAEYTLLEQETKIIISESLIRIRILVQSEEGLVLPYYLNIYTLPDNANATFTLDGEESIYDEFQDLYILKANTRESEEHTLLVQLEDELAKVKLADQEETVGVATQIVNNTQMGTTYEVAVTSQNMLVTKHYRIMVIAKDNNTQIQKLVVDNKILEPNQNGNYEYKVRHDVTNVNIALYSVSELSTIKIGDLIEGVAVVRTNANLPDEVTMLPIEIIAEDGTKAKSVLKISKMNDNTDILSLTVNATIVNKDEDGYYRYTVPEDTLESEVSVELADRISKVNIDGWEDKQGTITQKVDIQYEENIVTINVTSEEGRVQKHILIIHRISTDNILKSLTATGIKESAIKKTGEDTYEVTVPYTYEDIEITAITNSKYASVKLETMDEYTSQQVTTTVTLPTTETTRKILVQAENGDIKEYTVKFVKVHVLDIEYLKADDYTVIPNEEDSVIDMWIGPNDMFPIDFKTKDSTTQIQIKAYEVYVATGTGRIDQMMHLNYTPLGNTKLIVTLEDGSASKEYDLNIRKRSQDNSIEYVKIDEEEIPQVNGGYDKVLERKDIYNINIKATNEFAQIKIDNGPYKTASYVSSINMRNIEEKTYIITVKSQNGEEKTYPLHLRKKSKDTELTSINVDDKVISPVQRNNHIFVKYNATSANVKGIIENELSTIRMNDGEEKQFSVEEEIELVDVQTTVEFTVKAECGDEKVYTLVIEKESTNNGIEILKANGVTIEPDENGEYNTEILDTLASIPVYVKTYNKYAQIQINNNESVKEGQNTINVPIDKNEKYQSVEILVVAQNGEEKLYTLNIARRNNSTALEYLKVNTKPLKATGDTYETIIDLMDNVAQIEIKTVSEYANISYMDRTEKGLMTITLPVPEAQTEMEFTVTSETGIKKTYKVKLVKKSNDMSLKNVTVNGVAAQKQDDGNYYIEVLDSVQNANVVVTANDQKTTVQIEDEEGQLSTSSKVVQLEEKETKVSFTMTSEAGNSITSELTIRKVSNEKRVEIITVDEEEVTEYDANEFAYRKMVDNTKDGYYVLIMAKDVNATVKLGEEEAKGSLRTFIPVADSAKEVKFIIIAENGEQQEYSLAMIKASNNINVELVELNDFAATMTNPDKLIYEKMIPKLADTIKVKVVTENPYATIKIGDTSTKEGESVENIPLDLKEDVITIPVLVTAPDGYTVKTYNIILIRGRNNTDITKVTVEGKEIPYVNSKYVASVTGNKDTAEVTIKVSDEEATIEFNNESSKGTITTEVTLTGTTTTKEIKVIAQDGTAKYYTLEINRIMSIAGTISTPENVNNEHIAQITVYKTSDTRPIGDKDNPREVIASGESLPNGKFDIPVLEVETYDVVITKPGYLSYTIRRVKTTIGHTSIIKDTKELIAGDVISSGLIEADDLANIVDHYGTLPEINDNSTKEEIEFYLNEKRFDLNEDGIVNKLDRAIVKKNYDKQDISELWEDPELVNNTNAINMASAESITDTQTRQMPSMINNATVSSQMASGDASVTNQTNTSIIENTVDKLIKPMDCKYTITSEYGTRVHPVTGETKTHKGIDISGVHHTKIYAVADGEVTYSGVQNGYGNCIEIKHVVNGETIYTFYAHLSKIESQIKVGTKVKQGEVIALEGGDPKTDPNPGTSTGHHLHFEIRKISGNSSKNVDPNNYIDF